MPSPHSQYDVVVAGAGAPGIAAGRALTAAGLRVQIVEARNRSGGRAWTRLLEGRALDIGCAWLHSADVSPFRPLARDAGFAVDDSLPPWQRPPDAGIVAPQVHAAFRAEQAAFEERLREAAERDGEHGFAQQAISELCGVFGNAWRSRLRPVAASAWCSDPFALGSYSHALPGHADKRAILAAPVENRIFFAGEATSPDYFSTAHGAYESGLRAARQAIAALRHTA